MKRILFVDDVRNVLDGIRRNLRSQRSAWDMHFAESGLDAVAVMEEHAFDVVVSDMHMPGMGGVELLAHIRHTWPDVMRVILSGHSARESILKSVAVAHVFISKPCDDEPLLLLMVRASNLSATTDDAAMKTACSRIGFLPRSPKSAEEVATLLAHPEPNREALYSFAVSDPSTA